MLHNYSVKQASHEANLSSPSSTAVKNECKYTPPPPTYAFVACIGTILLYL